MENWKYGNGKPIKDFEKSIQQLVLNLNEKAKIIIGTDSQLVGSRISFVTAIVFWNVGFGGNFIYLKEHRKRDTKNSIIENRLFQQTIISVEIAKQIDELLNKYGFKIQQIHLDLNPNKKYRSNRILSSCVGYVKWNGYTPVVKPNSFVASDVADCLTR